MRCVSFVRKVREYFSKKKKLVGPELVCTIDDLTFGAPATIVSTCAIASQMVMSCTTHSPIEHCTSNVKPDRWIVGNR